MNIFWMKYSPLEGNVSATDPLAFDYLAQQLGYLPLPNFTGRTSRARYYSMVCYGLYICEAAIGRSQIFYNDESVMKFFEIYEKYWAYAVILSYNGELKERDNIEAGLRGKRGAIKAFNQKIRGLGNEYRLLSRQLELGGLGAYRSSLEKFGLINRSSLSLTMSGRELAESFLPVDNRMRVQYDELVIDSVLNERIIEKKGNASIRTFGEYTRLDFYRQNHFNTKEQLVIRKSIIESEPITLATSKMVHETKPFLKNDLISGIRFLSSYDSLKADEIYVSDCFKTILAFEQLSTALNDLFCTLLNVAYENGGMIPLADIEIVAHPFHVDIYSRELATILAGSPKYKEILVSYYGDEFARLVISIIRGLSPIQLVNTILTMHWEVAAKRQSSRWIDQDGQMLIAYSGYEYAKTNIGKRHNYKLLNLLSIINDAGWPL